MSVLLEPIINEAKEAAVLKAKEEADSSAISTLTQEFSAQQEESENGTIVYVIQNPE